MTKPMTNPKVAIKSTVTITAEEISDNHNSEIVMFTPSAQLSESSGLYFFIIYKELAPQKYTPVYKSETKKPTEGMMKWNQV